MVHITEDLFSDWFQIHWPFFIVLWRKQFLELLKPTVVYIPDWCLSQILLQPRVPDLPFFVGDGCFCWSFSSLPLFLLTSRCLAASAEQQLQAGCQTPTNPRPCACTGFLSIWCALWFFFFTKATQLKPHMLRKSSGLQCKNLIYVNELVCSQAVSLRCPEHIQIEAHA